MCRDGLQSSPGDLCNNAEIPGLLRSPFATQGRSYKDRARLRNLGKTVAPTKKESLSSPFPFNDRQRQPMVIRLALPPAAAVLTLTARSITRRSRAIW